MSSHASFPICASSLPHDLPTIVSLVPAQQQSIDMEKAFDRCSWDYLHGALEELGFGESFGRYTTIL